MKKIAKEQGDDTYVEGYVLVPDSVLIEGDIETFLDYISECLIGTCLLMDVSYGATGVKDGDIIYWVQGDASEAIDD